MIGKIITVILAIGAVIGGVWLLDDRNATRFARADDLKTTKSLLADSLKAVNNNINQTNVRIQYHILVDQANYIKREMQEIRVNCKTSNAYEMPTDARKRYNDFQIQLDQINLEIKNLSSGKQ